MSEWHADVVSDVIILVVGLIMVLSSVMIDDTFTTAVVAVCGVLILLMGVANLKDDYEYRDLWDE